MKRLLSGLLALVLTALLWGCGSVMPEQTVICGKLTITLPGDFIDLSDQSYAGDFEMVFGRDNVIVSVSKEPADQLKAAIPDIDAARYAQLVIDSNALSAQVETRDSIPNFTYTMGQGENAFTYLAGVFASEENFYMVQCYCPTEEFDGYQQIMWNYISTVRVR